MTIIWMSFFVKLKKFDDFSAVFDMSDDVFEIDFGDREIFENREKSNVICFFLSFFFLILMNWIVSWNMTIKRIETTEKNQKTISAMSNFENFSISEHENLIYMKKSNSAATCHEI